MPDTLVDLNSSPNNHMSVEAQVRAVVQMHGRDFSRAQIVAHFAHTTSHKMVCLYIHRGLADLNREKGADDQLLHYGKGDLEERFPSLSTSHRAVGHHLQLHPDRLALKVSSYGRPFGLGLATTTGRMQEGRADFPLSVLARTAEILDFAVADLFTPPTPVRMAVEKRAEACAIIRSHEPAAEDYGVYELVLTERGGYRGPSLVWTGDKNTARPS